MQQKVIIVGAGFSGLTAAYYFQSLGFAVEVLEEIEVPGGILMTRSTDYGPVDLAANGALLTPELESICKNIQLKILSPSPKSKNKFIFFKGKLAKWPFGLFESTGVLVSLVRFFLFKSRYQPEKNESLYSWGKRALSKTIVERLLEPAFQGVYATFSGNLSASLVVGPLLYSRLPKNKGKNSRRQTVGFEGGMGEFCRSLYTHLQDANVQFSFNLSQEEILKKISGSESKGAPIVLTCGQKSALFYLSSIKKLTNEPLPSLDFMKEIKYLDAAKVAFWIKKGEVQTDGFGCLFPKDNQVMSLGVLFDSCIFPSRYPLDVELVTFIIGDNVLSSVSTEAELIAFVKKDFSQVFKKSLKDVGLVHTECKIWRQAIPKYDSQLEQFLERIDKMQPISGNFYLHGNYLGRLGLSNILDQSKKLANRINYELSI